MTLLEIAQICSSRLQTPSPSTVIGNSSNNTRLLLAMINETIEKIANDFAWSELQRESSFTLVDGQSSYPLPADYDSRQNHTLWNRSQAEPLRGPVDAIEWQKSKSGLITTFPYQRYRVKGWQTNQFFIDPTPSSGEAGQICVFEYISTTARRPKFWTASTVFGANSYSAYNGNIYKTTSGGTTGSTAPTHTTGSASDGAVTWVYQTTYTTFLADTDEPILDNNLIIDGACWRFKKERGFDYEQDRIDAEKDIELAKTKLLGAEAINVSVMNMVDDIQLLSVLNYPEGNYGS